MAKKYAGLIMVLPLLITFSTVVLADDFQLIQPKRSDSLSYSDQNIRIRFKFNKEKLEPWLIAPTGYKKIHFTLENKTNQPITINWNESSIVLPGGESSKIMHGGVRFIKAGESMPPTTIPPNSKTSDTVIPAGNVSYSSGMSSGWHISPLGIFSGSEFGLYLRLKVGEQERNYNFRFLARNIDKKSQSDLLGQQIMGGVVAGLLTGAIVWLVI